MPFKLHTHFECGVSFNLFISMFLIYTTLKTLLTIVIDSSFSVLCSPSLVLR